MSAAEGGCPCSLREKIRSPLRKTLREPGAPARTGTEIPNAFSRLSLRLTASALMSAQKKQLLISRCTAWVAVYRIYGGEWPTAFCLFCPEIATHSPPASVPRGVD